MSLQVCHCGWSKVTSYQGLRIHQGKMGCTPKGTRITESEQYLWGNQGLPLKLVEPWRDVYTPVKDETTADISLQVCHCGWSKMTSYQGLRIHQGKMGCTPKGMRIPENEQYLWQNWQLRDIWLDNDVSVKKEQSVPVSTSSITQINPVTIAAAATVKDQTISSFGLLNRSSHDTLQKATNTVRQALDFSHEYQVEKAAWKPPTTTYQETRLQPQEEERPNFQVEKVAWKPPTTTYQETRLQPQEEERPNQRFSQARREKIKADLQQKIQMREQKVDEIRADMKSCKGSLDREWLEINHVFTEVMAVVEEARQEALQPLEERRQRVKREAKHLIQELQREIDKLENTIAELDRNYDSQGSPSATGLDDLRDWKKLAVDTSFSFGTLRTVTSTTMEQIQEKLEKLSSVELKRIPKFAVQVKLDPKTAHARLVLSDDGKEVRDGGEIQKVPDAPERFDLFGSVLGLNKLTSGKSYWEIDVGDKTGWDLGVARSKANRRGKLSLSPDNGYWVAVHYDDKHYAAMTSPPVSLSLKEKPQKVGVFVDYEEGLLSFYDVKARSHIYSFTGCSFAGELRPYLSPHFKQNKNNADPLIISAVKHNLRV